MSDTEKVEGAADDKSTEQIWNELTEGKAGQVEGPPEKPEETVTDPPQPAAAETPAPEVKADDLWKDAPAELREAHEREVAARVSAEQAARTQSGRLSKTQLQLNDLKANLASQRDPGAAPKEEAEDRETRRAQLREEYPDSVGPVLDDLVNLETEIREIRAGQTAQAASETETLLQEQTAALESVHPTFRDDVAKPAFVTWALQQPDYVQDAIRANAKQIVDGASAADILTRYHRDTADPAREAEAERRREQLEAARDPVIRNPAAATPAGDGSVEQIWGDLTEKRQRSQEQNKPRR